jgi:hypothetical protein
MDMETLRNQTDLLNINNRTLKYEYNLTADGLCPPLRGLPPGQFMHIGDEEMVCSVPISGANISRFQTCCNLYSDSPKDRPLSLVWDEEHILRPACWVYCKWGASKGVEDWESRNEEFKNCYGKKRDDEWVGAGCFGDKAANKDASSESVGGVGRPGIGTVAILMFGVLLAGMVL